MQLVHIKRYLYVQEQESFPWKVCLNISWLFFFRARIQCYHKYINYNHRGVLMCHNYFFELKNQWVSIYDQILMNFTQHAFIKSMVDPMWLFRSQMKSKVSTIDLELCSSNVR